LLAYVPSHHATFMQDPVTAKARLTLNNLVVSALGLGFWGSVVTIAWQRCGSWREASRRLAARCGRAETRFLVLWLGIEVLGYFALSPYPAVRRVLGIVVAATALIGHAASVTCRGRARRLLLRGVVMGGIVLGLAYYVVDLVEATTEKAAAEEAARYVRSRDTHGSLWFVGFWGFQYYARRAGMQPAYPNLSALKKGDWLVVPEERIAFQRVRSDDKALELVGQLSLEDRIPLSTKPAYYAGRSAIVHHEGPRVSVWVYRVTRDYIFASSW